jgi:Restriction endonuclease
VADALPRLNKLLARLGGPTIPDASAPPPQEAPRAPAVILPSVPELQALRDAFVQLHPLAPQSRGVAFEKFLSAFFDAWGLQARGSFRNRGEEIDGSFVHAGATYLLEAKWQDRPVNAQTLHGFQGKVTERPEWTRGLFISYGGFSDQAPDAFTSRRIILMDGTDIMQVLMRSLSLVDVICEKLRHAAERKDPYGKVAELFPSDG